MTITVINLSHNRNVEGYRCDGRRPTFDHRVTVLGNPFHMFHESERTAVVAAFREYLHQVANQGANPVEVAPGLAEKYNVQVSGMWKRLRRTQVMEELVKLEAMTEVKLHEQSRTGNRPKWVTLADVMKQEAA